jgi:hypothetical protein
MALAAGNRVDRDISLRGNQDSSLSKGFSAGKAGNEPPNVESLTLALELNEDPRQ